MDAKNSGQRKTGHAAFVEEHRKKLAEAFADVLSEKGLEWRKGWTADTAVPRNGCSGKPYHGVNRLYLSILAMQHGYTDPRWMSMTQIMDLKGTYHPGEKWHLQAGSKAVHVEYWYPFDTEEKKALDWKDWNKLPAEERDSSRYQLRVRYTPVFHASMVDGISPWLPVPRQEQPLSEVVGKLSRSMGVDLRFDGGNRAFYSPGEDKIHLPSPSAFHDEYEFNATALHELTHATGHSSRLARDLSGGFGSESYAYEELVAEIGSAFMGVALDTQQMPQHLENHKAYVQGWIDAIREKPEMLAKAISDAQSAAAYMDQKMELIEEHQKVIGVATWANGEVHEYTDAKAFIEDVAEELPYRSTSGFSFANLSSEPEVCKALDDLVYGEYGEDNPTPMSQYEEHAALAAQMNNLGYERIYVPGFSKDFMMWKDKDTAPGKEFGLDGWDGVRVFLNDIKTLQEDYSYEQLQDAERLGYGYSDLRATYGERELRIAIATHPQRERNEREDRTYDKVVDSYRIATMVDTRTQEQNIVASGKCGESLTWELNNKGVLTVSGIGTMFDFGPSSSRVNTPWDLYTLDIRSVVIESGVFSVGNEAFSDCLHLTDVTISESVKILGNYSFGNCPALSKFGGYGSEMYIAEDAFEGCTALPSHAALVVTSATSDVSVVKSLKEFLGERGLSSPVSDFMLDKTRFPHGLTQRQRNAFEREAEQAEQQYSAERSAAITEYRRLVADGKIVEPTAVERLLRTAVGHDDNAATHAARRALEKRGTDWRAALVNGDIEYRQQVQAVYNYENANNIPENDRMTTWAPGQTVPTAKPWYKENDSSVMDRPPDERRIGITERMIADRYTEIQNSLQAANSATNGFYGMITYVSFPAGRGHDLVSFYDNQKEYESEITYQKQKGTSNYGTVLSRDQFIANIAQVLETSGHYIAIGAYVHGDYTAEVAQWKNNHPIIANVHPDLAELTRKVNLVHNWEQERNIDKDSCVTQSDEHTGQILITDKNGFEVRYAQIAKHQQPVTNCSHSVAPQCDSAFIRQAAAQLSYASAAEMELGE